MKKQIMTIAFGIFLLAFISAAVYYPGETIIIENEMGIENLVYTIIGNSSYVSELDVVINSTNISITFPQDMIPDSFDIVFIEEPIKEVTNTVYVGGGGGGGTRTKYVDRNVTQYKDKIIEKEKIVEKEIITPGEVVKEYVSKTGAIIKVLIALFVLFMVLLLSWNFMVRKNEKREEIYDNSYKEVEKNE